MSAKRRHTVTTIESHEYWIVRRPDEETPNVLCEACPGKLGMLTPQQAAQQEGVCERTVFRWIDEGVIHFAETAEGLFVCLAPLTIDAR